MKYLPLFVLVQLVSVVLFVIGLPVCAILAFTGQFWWTINDDRLHYPRWAWIWDNQEDGVAPRWYNPGCTRWKVFMWTALRNNVNNLRYVPGVSAKGRPLWIRNWTIRDKVYYAKAGWLSNGYPVISAGSGRW